MRRDTDRHRLFTRRALLVAGGQGLLLAGLGARLYQLQVIESERYRVLARKTGSISGYLRHRADASSIASVRHWR
ncbi:MAG: hypothetical protein HC834_10630 [Rhodospirillales bacterium]|nr:hypothetical protein [Rhodospirillales bacterium]